MTRLFLFCVCTLIAMLLPISAHATPEPFLSLYGDVKYKSGFTHFDYTNPDAPKGGTLRLSALGTFDSFNPYIIKGNPAAGINTLTSISLMEQSYDEPFTMYGFLAETVERAEDNSSVTFNLNKSAVWDDGQPITADDVVWTFNTLVKDGAPFYRAYYADVKEVTANSPTQVTFKFVTSLNRELPLIIAQMNILPKHYWKDKKFGESTLIPPLSGGPYKVGAFQPGQTMEFVRNPNWWGKDLPVNKGRYNFDRVVYSYYRDQNVALEAFLAGNFDVQQESVAKLWATAYNAPAVTSGRIVKQEIPNSNPAGMQAFIFNIRRPVFQDIAVRKAINYAFDFEWENKQFAYGAYTRTRSFFENSELGAIGLPASDELKILEPLRSKIPAEVFTTEFTPPSTNGAGNNRANLKTAADILDAAGYKIGADGIREKNGTRLSFEFMVDNPAFERWALPFIQNLQKIGIKATFRVLDDAQYQNRVRKFDYDMTLSSFPQSNSPGNEQREFWTSEKATQEGSRNLIGIQSEAVDTIVKGLIGADTRVELIAHCRALDRVLQWNYFVVPNWYYNKWRLAWWAHLDHPEKLSGTSPGIIDTWWVRQK